MHFTINYVGFVVIRLISALLISFLLLTAVSMLHEIIDADLQTKTNVIKTKVEVQAYKKEPEPEKKAQQKFRQVTSQTSGPKSGGGEKMSLKFSPELGIDAGQGSGDGVVMQSKELEAEIFDEGQTDEDVVPEHVPPIPFPDRAREQGVEGEFIAIIIIDHAGRVASMDILQSPHQSISNDARKIINSWRFRPAKNKGVPVNVRKRVIFEFKLD